MSFALSIIGIIMFFWGLVHDQGIALWVVGVIVSIPGFYFTYKIIRAYLADPYERKEILDEIPDM